MLIAEPFTGTNSNEVLCKNMQTTEFPCCTAGNMSLAKSEVKVNSFLNLLWSLSCGYSVKEKNPYVIFFFFFTTWGFVLSFLLSLPSVTITKWEE